MKNKTYFLNSNGEIKEYNDLYECLDDIIDDQFVIEELNEFGEYIDIPIVGQKGIGDIVEAFGLVNDVKTEDIDYWVSEIEDSLNMEDSYYFYNGDISYNKELLEEMRKEKDY